MLNHKKEAVNRLVILVKKILKTKSTGTVLIDKKSVDLDILKNKIPGIIIEERCTDVINSIIAECVQQIKKELDARMTAHINKRHS